MTTEPIGDAPPPLAGLAVAVTAARRHRELANSLTQHGAMVSEFPLLRLVSVGAEPALRWATQRCLEAPPHIVVVTTAGGWRRWLAAAATWNVSQQLVEALHHATIAARGEAAAAAVRESGLPVAWMAPAETVDELVSWLGKLDLTGRRVVVQEHGGALAALQAALTEQGADVTRVVTERWAPLANRAPARRLATMVARRELHAVVFTNAAAVSTLLDTASQSGGFAGLLKAFATDVAAVCVNPTVAAPLTGHGLPVICSPEPSPGAVGGVLRDRVRSHSTSRIMAGGHHFLLAGARRDSGRLDGRTLA